MKENNIENEKNKIGPNKAGFITKVSAQYCDKFPIRAAIQAIPGIGSSLDTMLAGLGAKWQYERLEDFVSKLNEKLNRAEQSGKLGSVEPSEAWFDFMMQTFDRVIKTRSEEKRMRFANLVAKQVVNQCDWDQAETACRLIGELSDIHIRILDVAIKAPVYKDVSGRGVITVEDKSAVPQFFKDKVINLRDCKGRSKITAGGGLKSRHPRHTYTTTPTVSITFYSLFQYTNKLLFIHCQQLYHLAADQAV